MGKKPRSETCSGGWCRHHLLEMGPIRGSQCYLRKRVKLRLCPRLNSSQTVFQSTMPLINHDRKFYTPCFILQEEQVYYQQNDEKLQGHHQVKVAPSQSNTIYIAKHGRKRNYCSVCRCDYDDYMEHVEQKSHKQLLRNNKFNKYILQTAQVVVELRSAVPEVVIQEKEVLATEETDYPLKVALVE